MRTARWTHSGWLRLHVGTATMYRLPWGKELIGEIFYTNSKSLRHQRVPTLEKYSENIITAHLAKWIYTVYFFAPSKSSLKFYWGIQLKNDPKISSPPLSACNLIPCSHVPSALSKSWSRSVSIHKSEAVGWEDRIHVGAVEAWFAERQSEKW